MSGETIPNAVYNKDKSRRGYQSVKAVDPHDGGEWDVLVSDETITYTARKKGMGAALELAHTVRWAVKNPSHIFRGVRDDDRGIDGDGWLCYVASPDHGYDFKTNEKRPPWDDEVFLVYVTDERVLYQWYWVDKSPEDDSLPIDFQLRFTEKVL